MWAMDLITTHRINTFVAIVALCMMADMTIYMKDMTVCMKEISHNMFTIAQRMGTLANKTRSQ